jgi:thymidylate synthase
VSDASPRLARQRAPDSLSVWNPDSRRGGANLDALPVAVRFSAYDSGMGSFETFGEAYVSVLRDVLRDGAVVAGTQDPTSVGSNFGRAERPTREILGYAFEVRDPSASVVVSPARTSHLAFCFGLFLWTLSGSDSESWIHYYNPRAGDFSDDGVHLSAPFGLRLFDNSGVDQIEAIFKKMASDPYSRRTAASILLPSDNQQPTRDYPCAVGVQYLQRQGRLHAITFMRSQSALKVLPYDVFVFMNLQRWLASRLGVVVGTYRHFSASLHVYEDELRLARRVLNEGVTTTSVGPFDTEPQDSMDMVCEFEAELRSAVESNRPAALRSMVSELRHLEREINPRSFQHECRTVLLVDALRRLRLQSEREELLAKLDPGLRQLASFG